MKQNGNANNLIRAFLSTYAFELVSGHVDIVNILVGFLEGVHHGRLKILDGYLVGLGIIILLVPSFKWKKASSWQA